jgi:hypothetical protein
MVNRIINSGNRGKVWMAAAIALTMVNHCCGQQYASDSWLSKKHGTVTLIATTGTRNSMIMNTYSLFPKWEFTMAAYLYNNDGDPLTNDGYSATIYGKYMFYQNKKETGGAAVKAGTGMFPGNLNGEERAKDAFKTFWTNVPVTIPLFNNKISWDLMPGASTTVNYGNEKTTVWGFTYATRVAYYPFNEKASVVGETFGTAGDAGSSPEYKIGLRWEPSQYGVFAVTYGRKFNGEEGAGIEVGIMIFTPQFACFKGCNRPAKEKQPKKEKQKKEKAKKASN